VWEAPDACEECEPTVVAQRTYCRNCGLTIDAAATAAGTAGPLWARLAAAPVLPGR
jgi:predicted amidophosphoribosyltransferase